MTTGRLQPGTVLGELGRSVLQFKSFPITMMTRHWRRMLNNPGRISKAEYSAALIAGTTLMGAVGVQLNELLNGRDPLDMQQPAFWGRAALKGGSLGFTATSCNRKRASTVPAPLLACWGRLWD